MTSEEFDIIESAQLRQWDNTHVWHPFTPMTAHRSEESPIIVAGEGFELIDVSGRRYLDGISSLWCNIHGHCVPQINQAVKQQLDRVAHSTLLGLASEPSIRLARQLAQITPDGLKHVFYSDSGSTAVEVAIKLAYQYQRQKSSGSEPRDLFICVGEAYHGDTIGSVSVGGIDLFHHVYGQLLFPTKTVPAPVALRIPSGHTRDSWIQYCFDEVERIVREEHQHAAGFVIEPLVQGAAGILVHPPGYLTHVRRLCTEYRIPLIIDEVATGFGRTGKMFACEHEDVKPDIMCLAKGITGGYLPLAATLTTDEISEAFLGQPHEGRTFFHGHTYTGNPLGCAAAIASLELFQQHDVMANVDGIEQVIARKLHHLADHPHVAEVRQRGIMVGIELVADRSSLLPFESEHRLGHRVTLAARERGVILRPLGDVIVLMPAPAMPLPLVERICDVALESIDAAIASLPAVDG
ncbi:MAG: adenosylmethionine--8-amino-7-oxononanoate transaminase [Fuerstiella sp.]|nr:adenosylmethionine--8-amino-7-oxononanoate transaminase [Fuerstiella sp.]